MKPNKKFLRQPKTFWAYVRSVSQHVGYTEKKNGPLKGSIKIPSIQEIADALNDLELDASSIRSNDGGATELGMLLHQYFVHRASALNVEMPAQLMTAKEAKAAFDELYGKHVYKCALPKNKQTGSKQGYAYLTGLVNMIIEAEIGEQECNFNPQSLTTITINRSPVRTFARRFDGAFPSVVNPIAVWEVKEYYHTTTFGSRIADGVYETMLDGLEMEELYASEQIKVLHYLMIDGYSTWWEKGKSYLCRIVDMLHMGYVDEVLVGREVPALLPGIVRSWIKPESSKFSVTPRK